MEAKEYVPSPTCKRNVDVELLKSYEGHTFPTFAKLCYALGWKKYRNTRCINLDKKRLSHYCELEFYEGSHSVTIVKVY